MNIYNSSSTCIHISCFFSVFLIYLIHVKAFLYPVLSSVHLSSQHDSMLGLNYLQHPRQSVEDNLTATVKILFHNRSRMSVQSLTTSLLFSSKACNDEKLFWKRITTSFPSSPNSLLPYTENDLSTMQLITLLRVSVPSIIAGISGTFAFPSLALFLASIMNDAGVFAVLSQDSSQFVQNFLTVSGLLFSILVGQTYAFLYTQQESIFYALFNEVTEAKCLLEQVALVCQGRSMYYKVLESISKYVCDDLKQLKANPAVLISSRPVDDPLESIMYMTSVGVPSSVYDTVKSLRQIRATRLGSLQRKLPRIHMVLLWILAAIELVSFPLLGAGTQTIGGYNILTIEGCLFGVMTFGIVMTMRVIAELYRPGGSAYNVDGVLSVMVKGLEEELKERLGGGKRYVSSLSPSAQFDVAENDLSLDTKKIPGEAPIVPQNQCVKDLNLSETGGTNEWREKRS